MLNDPDRSPPVPQVSTSIPSGGVIFLTFRRMSRAKPVISSTLSPFIRSPVRKAAIWAGVARPDMMLRIMSSDSSMERSFPEITRSIPSFIFIPFSRPDMTLRIMSSASSLLRSLPETTASIPSLIFIPDSRPETKLYISVRPWGVRMDSGWN